MLAPWGYEIDGEGIPPLLTAEAFDTMTGGRYVGDGRVQAALAAVSAAIRNECGWHVSPSLGCVAVLTSDGSALRLPSNCVTEVTSVSELGAELDANAYEWRRLGLVRLKSRGMSKAWDAYEVSYTAGYDAGAVPDLAMTVAGIAEGVLALPKGVASESADGVSISYMATAQSVASALTSQQRAALAPYRLVSSHAA